MGRWGDGWQAVGRWVSGLEILFVNVLCKSVANFLVIFIVACHEGVRAVTRRRMKTNTNGLRSILVPHAMGFS
jgi:hypothetical protein